MKVKDHILLNDDNRRVLFKETNNQGGNFSKFPQINPRYLIIHYTSGGNAKGTIEWFQNPDAKVSAHLVIDRDGSIFQVVKFDTIAWHAGESEWYGWDAVSSEWTTFSALNNCALGIELVNAGQLTYDKETHSWKNSSKVVVPTEEVIKRPHKNDPKQEEYGWHIYPDAQIKALEKVAVALKQTYPLTDILGHDEIALGRKLDPGPAFDMENFRLKILGWKYPAS